ncbi:MAG: hypothetical protein ABIP51_16430 [Bacteroidia bacterium]
MKKLFLFFSLLFIFFFQGCSWQEYFLVSNPTGMDLIVEYEVESPAQGFAIFDNYPTGYKIYKSGDIKWDEPVELKDMDTARAVVRIILSPGTAVIFGHLSNDHYKKHDQVFINDRHFNLKRLIVQKGEFTRDITVENFDDNIVKRNGIISVKTK